MDRSIIVVAPERACSAAKRHISPAQRAHSTSRSSAACHWLTARDDLNTYRLCVALFLIGTLLAVANLTVIEAVMGVICGHI